MATKNTNAPIVNDTLIDWVIKEEGFLDKPTNIGDGKITLGSGLTAQKWRDKYRKNDNKWTKQDNRAAVREELESRKRWAEDTIPNWENLPDDTKRAMLSYKYNYDFDAKNSPKLFSAMKSGDYIEAVRQMDATSKDPKFKKGLQERRNREQAWGLGALIGSNTPIYQEALPIVEYPDNTRVFNPYTPLFENALSRPALVPTNPTTNYVEARQAEPEEWQQDDALAAFKMLERAKNYRDSMLWENQPELPQREYNPTEAPYLVTRYDEGGQLEKKKTWDELSVKEKADMMRVAVENGITSLSEIKDKYDEFAEGGNTEDDVVLPEQVGFIYKGPTPLIWGYSLSKKQ